MSRIAVLPLIVMLAAPARGGPADRAMETIGAELCGLADWCCAPLRCPQRIGILGLA